MNPEKSSAIAERQAALAEALLLEAGQAQLQKQPLDRWLARWWRKHPELGARDRRFLGDWLFAYWRWWGWLRALPSEPWSLQAWAVGMLEGQTAHPACQVWQARLGLDLKHPLPSAEASLAQKHLAFAEIFNVSRDDCALEALLPDWLWGQVAWADSLEARLDWLQAWQQRAPLWIRWQGSQSKALEQQLRAKGIQWQVHPFLSAAWELHGRLNFPELPAFQKGELEIQDLSSQAVGHVCAPQAGESWWDVCAGGGGKTLHLAALMQGRGKLLATEIRAHKLEELQTRARRGGWQNIRTQAWQGELLPVAEASQAGVLVDAPCSGSGTWRRNPDARWRLGLEQLPLYALTQARLLSLASGAVKPGGVLVYATCSLCQSENEEIVTVFLSKHPDFEAEAFQHPLTGRLCEGWSTLGPPEFAGDGMFVARLRRGKAFKSIPSHF